jgi:hypothetical protein
VGAGAARRARPGGSDRGVSGDGGPQPTRGLRAQPGCPLPPRRRPRRVREGAVARPEPRHAAHAAARDRGDGGPARHGPGGTPHRRLRRRALGGSRVRGDRRSQPHAALAAGRAGSRPARAGEAGGHGRPQSRPRPPGPRRRLRRGAPRLAEARRRRRRHRARRLVHPPPRRPRRSGVRLGRGECGHGPRPRRRARRQRAAHSARRRGLRGLGPRVGRRRLGRPRRHGALCCVAGWADMRGRPGRQPRGVPGRSRRRDGVRRRPRGLLRLQVAPAAAARLPTVRRFQAEQAEVTVDWLRRRTGWP